MAYLSKSPKQVWSSFSKEQRVSIEKADIAGDKKQSDVLLHNAIFDNLLDGIARHMQQLQKRKDWLFLHILPNAISCGILGLIIGICLLTGLFNYFLAFVVLYLVVHLELLVRETFLFRSPEISLVIAVSTQFIFLYLMYFLGVQIRLFFTNPFQNSLEKADLSG